MLKFPKKRFLRLYQSMIEVWVMNRKAIIKVFFIATITALFVRGFFIENYRIASNSMAPTLPVGELIFVSKSAFSIKLPFSSYELVKFSRPRRSDIVAFSLPQYGNVTHVKRVVAIAGDRVEIKDGNLYINGKPSHYDELNSPVRRLASTEGSIQLEKVSGSSSYPIQIERKNLPNYGPVDVPANHFFVLGDNRSDSIDSRTWGPVPYSCLKGKVFATF